MTVTTMLQTASATPPAEARWRWYDLLLIGVLWVALLFGGIVLLAIGFMIARGGQPDQAALLASLPFNLAVLAVQAVTLLAAVAAGLRWRHMHWRAIGLIATALGWLLGAVAVAVGLRVLMIPLGLLIQALGLNTDNPQLAFLVPGGVVSTAGFVGMLLLAGVAIAFVEEAFFRGVIYRYLRRWGVGAATLISALIFAVAHFNLLVGITAFCLGIGTALVYERSRSLWASFIVHSVFNTLGIGILYIALLLGVPIPGVS